MRVDECRERDQTCYTYIGPNKGTKEFLNVNGPLQIGGISIEVKSLKSYMGWKFIPNSKHFSGCIANLSLNGEVTFHYYYTLATELYLNTLYLFVFSFIIWEVQATPWGMSRHVIHHSY